MEDVAETRVAREGDDVLFVSDSPTAFSSLPVARVFEWGRGAVPAVLLSALVTNSNMSLHNRDSRSDSFVKYL